MAGASDAGVTYALATALLGFTDTTLLDDTIDAISAADGATLFGVVDRVIEAGHDPRRFARTCWSGCAT
jgi:DNA polymerase-3 subunit gamma/tau